MKIVHKATYEVERMSVKDFLADHQYRRFMLAKDDIPSFASNNIAYLESLKKGRKLYVVNDVTETTEVIR
jgi:hypothetical protein